MSNKKNAREKRGIATWAPPISGAGLAGRRIAAMVVNNKAGGLEKRGALQGIDSKLAPQVLR
jgi:hypothetical protein